MKLSKQEFENMNFRITNSLRLNGKLKRIRGLLCKVM